MALTMARPQRQPNSSNFYFRRAIPEEHRAFAGMREFKRSLGTSDAREAKLRHSARALEYDALIERAKAATNAEPTPHTPGPQHAPETLTHLSLGDVHALAGDLWRWLLAEHAANPAPGDSFSNIAPDGHWGTREEPWTGHRYSLYQARRARLPASGQQIVAGRVKEFLASRRIELSGEHHKAFCEAARDAIDGALADLQRRHRGDLTESTVLASYPETRPEAPRAKPKVKITGLIETWAKSREGVRQRTRDEFKRRLVNFSKFVGHNDAQAVTAKDLRGWRDSLKGTLKAKTINESCVAPVKAIFATAEAEGVLTSNPFAGLRIALKADKTKEKPRRKYKDKEPALLLRAARKRTDALRWLTWLMAYTGARINELAQLRKEDVQRERGIDFLGITGSDEKGHEIKTSASRRKVPIHRALIAEGFLKFVVKAPNGWLFSDLPAGRYGKRGDAASKRYGRWARGEVGITDTRATAHSWRHRMEDQLREVEAPQEVKDGIIGHALKGQGGSYGDGPPLRVKAKWLAKVPVVKV